MNIYYQYILIILQAVLVYTVLVGFIAPMTIEKDLYRRRINNISERDLKSLKEKERAEKNLMTSLSHYLADMSDKMESGNQKNDEKYNAVAQQLYSAGLNIHASTYIFVKNAATVVGGLIGLLLFIHLDDQALNMRLMDLIACAAGPMIISRYYVSIRVTMRKEEIEKQLPQVLDLVSLAVDAGMGFDQALSYVCDNMTGPLIDELRIVVQEMSLGKTRRDAFESLSQRTGIDSVTNFASAVVQATEMGIPLKNILKSQAEAVRRERVASVKAKAAKASIKMLLPMVFFIFPVIFIILMGPAVMNMMQNLG